ncbi:Abi family protein [Aliarcobacter butzleri]|uniref:Abi family protein n=1 Tax=Aliarcobacter butzleri TaxID=28197 RepID=UPI001EDB781B|nr:Abi family protein [Aliarcobacter butzleri]MCG3658319.1 Abi family protein [Aliarcobacter butzleri]
MNDKFYSSLENSISQSRLSTYRNSNSNDRQVVIDYILNAKISENFYFLLQNLEVSLRNAIYESFKLNYQNKDFFFLHETDSRERYKERKEKHSRECWKMICAAKYNVQSCNTTINDGKIIAELNFGFWTKLLLSTDAKYTNMWRKIFNDVFPNYEIVLSIDNDRIIVGKIIDKIRDLRNRIFHYEPIFNKNLEQMHKDIIEVIGWINKDMQQLSLIFDEYETIQQKREYISNKLLY